MLVSLPPPRSTLFPYTTLFRSLEEELAVTLRGRDVVTGLPKAVDVSSVELREAISQPVSELIEVVKIALEETPPELVARSEEHTSELQSLRHLVCRLLLEKKKT